MAGGRTCGLRWVVEGGSTLSCVVPNSSLLHASYVLGNINDSRKSKWTHCAESWNVDSVVNWYSKHRTLTTYVICWYFCVKVFTKCGCQPVSTAKRQHGEGRLQQVWSHIHEASETFIKNHETFCFVKCMHIQLDASTNKTYHLQILKLLRERNIWKLEKKEKWLATVTKISTHVKIITLGRRQRTKPCRWDQRNNFGGYVYIYMYV